MGVEHANVLHLTVPVVAWLGVQKWELRVAVMHRDDMVEAAMLGDLERVDVQLQRDLPDINHINKKVRFEGHDLSSGVARLLTGPMFCL